MNEKIKIRIATWADAKQLLAIYAPYVTETTVTFEYDVPSIEEFTYRINNVLQSFPYYVAVMDDEVVGYCYASPFRTRAAYQWMVETTIYIKQDFRGSGIGTMLYSSLEATLKKQGILTMVACIAYPNPASIAFHEANGFEKVGHFSKSGYKLSQWVDVVWMEKHINPHNQTPTPFVPFSKIKEGNITHLS
ncbi:N-acetyltransferase family protein [Anaerotignum sp.]|uniref:GNAT family N-acetyltransferase n=1 Tax=Anaerotignum sp. TaxID=2039241 RepID=UPI00332239EB